MDSFWLHSKVHEPGNTFTWLSSLITTDSSVRIGHCTQQPLCHMTGLQKRQCGKRYRFGFSCLCQQDYRILEHYPNSTWNFVGQVPHGIWIKNMVLLTNSKCDSASSCLLQHCHLTPEILMPLGQGDGEMAHINWVGKSRWEQKRICHPPIIS